MLALLALLGSSVVLGDVKVYIGTEYCSSYSDCVNKYNPNGYSVSLGSASDRLRVCAFGSGLEFPSQNAEFIYREKSSNAVIETEIDSIPAKPERYSWYDCDSMTFGSAWENPEESFDNMALFSGPMTFTVEYRLGDVSIGGDNGGSSASAKNEVTIGAVSTAINYVRASLDTKCDDSGGSITASSAGKTNDETLFYICHYSEWLSASAGYRVEVYQLANSNDMSGGSLVDANPSVTSFKGYGKVDARAQKYWSVEADDLGLDSSFVPDNTDFYYRIKLLVEDSFLGVSISEESVMSIRFSDTI